MVTIVVIKFSLSLMIIQLVLSAPIISDDDRTKKSVSYYEFLNENNEDEDDGNYDNNLYSYYDENDISRSIPKRKRIKNPLDSPIYYIKLPPQPYMFVPGFGYMSQPPRHHNPHQHMNDFLNLPVHFLSNGKPSNIYQWNAATDYDSINNNNNNHDDDNENEIPIVNNKKDSDINRLKGEFVFNGKPNDIYVLRDPYNTLYSDTLQNFYP